MVGIFPGTDHDSGQHDWYCEVMDACLAYDIQGREPSHKEVETPKQTRMQVASYAILLAPLV
jgi:hypothetical protein